MTPEAREQISDRIQLGASVAWLLMDYAWLEQWPMIAMSCAVPAVLGSVVAVAFVEAHAATRAVTVAMAAWSVMNASWMLSDLGIIDVMVVARVAFAIGAGALVFAFAKGRLGAGAVGTRSARIPSLAHQGLVSSHGQRWWLQKSRTTV